MANNELNRLIYNREIYKNEKIIHLDFFNNISYLKQHLIVRIMTDKADTVSIFVNENELENF